MRKLILLSIIAVFGQITVAAADISIIVRTFIPGQHPGIAGYMLPVPGHPGKTMLPEAPVGQCFGTDSRSFSVDRNASSRFGGLITVDPDGTGKPALQPITGVTREYDCDTGAVICEETAGSGGFSIGNVVVTSTEISFTYKGEASNPCLFVAPDIEFEGKVRIDRASRTVRIDAKNDVFPSFEAILYTPGGANSLFQMDPEGQSTPADLVTSSASRPASGHGKY